LFERTAENFFRVDYPADSGAAETYVADERKMVLPPPSPSPAKGSDYVVVQNQLFNWNGKQTQ
jgi:hypothetical protein